MSERPRIAVSACLMHEDPQRAIFKGKALQYTEQKMAHALWRAGGLPIPLLDLRSRESLVALLRECEGLLLQGGADVAPGAYGEQPLRPEWSGDALRDRFEIAAIEVAIELGKPVLGICRGHQVLNVALGGSLHQDIAAQVEGSLLHREWARYEQLEHPVALAPDSWIAEVYERAPQLLVNTVHHQAIKQLATPLRATAWAPDSIIEAVEQIDGERWLVGVQWHPEWLDGSSEGGAHRSSGAPVFERFVAVCRERGR